VPGAGNRTGRHRVEWTRALLDGLELNPEIARQRLAEPGANAAAVDQPLILVAPHEQGTQPVL
jgi:hypothetical protein